jgi:hypothetical protein
MKTTLPYVRGKTVSFSTAESTLAVESPQFQKQGGRLFVVGTIPRGATTSDWALGVQCAVAWSAVTDYMVFDSVEDYRRRLAKSRRKK